LHEVSRALPHLRLAVQLAPNNAAYHSNLGYALQLALDHAGAISEYKRAIELDPRLGSAWINLGTAFAQTGQRDEARKAFQKALEIDPSDPRAKTNLQELADLADAGPPQGATK